jgi:uncharacterized protein YjbI with pentapeptide repeats
MCPFREEEKMNTLTNVSGKEFVENVLAGERDFRNIALPPYLGLPSIEGYDEMRDYLAAQDFSKDPVDIRGADMTGLQAGILLLPGLKGTGANLHGAVFIGQGKQEVYAHDQDLYVGSNFRGAELEGADLENAVLNNADLERANLRAANLTHARLETANLRGASLGYGINRFGGERPAILHMADLSKAQLQEADLQDAYCAGATFSEARLEGANLKNAFVPHANFSKAHLDGAIALEKAIGFESANYQETRVSAPQALRLYETLRGVRQIVPVK